jgi:hypothetical protein
MAPSSTTFHESEDRLSPTTREMHRALVSLMEELEAVDWYQQRVEGTADQDLRRILEHNRDEEKEHAAMLLEWIRRHDRGFDERLRMYLYREGPITELEAAAPESASRAEGRPSASAMGLIGSLRGSS